MRGGPVEGVPTTSSRGWPKSKFLSAIGAYASWSDAQRIYPNMLRCYQEVMNELDDPMDLPKILAGMEALRGRRTNHTCL
jgi:hypothetical protein